MIVDHTQQLSELAGKSIFLYPICTDARLHKHHNPIKGFVAIDTSTKKSYVISNGHPEGIYNTKELTFLKDCKVYCYDTMALRYAGYDVSSFVDVSMQYYLCNSRGHEFETSGIVSHYVRHFPNCFKVNELITLSKHEEVARQIFEEMFIEEEQPGLQFYQNKLMSVFHFIEKQGIQINTTLFVERFGDTLSRNNDLCFTQYNYFTTTGRPSNRFGGINFAALNKDDETRDCFINRFGSLMEVDFNSYHPRLIGSIIGYDFGKDNVYEHLAKHYYNTSKPTKEEIKEAKEATFKQLYGGIQKQYLHIPFFESTNNLALLLWKEANEKGYIESPISGRKLILANYQDISCYVLFNYFIQMYETEHNVLLLSELFKKLDSSIVPILYTYDSVLFDLPTEKQESLKAMLKEVIPPTFPLKIKTGTNYKDLR